MLENKLRSDDRVLVLRPIEGKATVSSAGITDNRLFTGENVLHARMDVDSCLWELSYEKGNLPPALKTKFTSFKSLKAFAETYYKNRNIEIVEVRD